MPWKEKTGRKFMTADGRRAVFVDNEHWTFEHRLIAEKAIGRKLLPGEVVHHKNHDRADNRPENLEVLPSQSEHIRLHMTPEVCRQGQLKGAETKYRKMLDVTLPSVVRGIRGLIDAGIKPTQRACHAVPKYSSIQRYFPQATLVQMAQDLEAQ